MSAPTSRPWYCGDAFVAEYRESLREDGDQFPMLKKLKILRAIIVNLGVVVIVLYAIYRGGDATFLGGFGLTILGAYNGVEILDYAALVQAYKEEVQDGGGSQD